MADIVLKPLTAKAFEPFGQVIEAPKPCPDPVPVVRHDALADLDLDSAGSGIVSLMAVNIPVSLPYRPAFLERHPFSSQAFYPCDGQEMIVLVALGDDEPDLHTLVAFRTNGLQGINIKRNLWHGPLASFQAGHFIVVDREGPGENGQVFQLSNAGIDVVS